MLRVQHQGLLRNYANRGDQAFPGSADDAAQPVSSLLGLPALAVTGPDEPALDAPTDHAAVIVVEADAGTRNNLSQLLPPGWVPQAFGSLDEADGARIEPGRPVILLLGPSQATEDALQRAAATLKATPGTGAVLVLDFVSPRLMSLALRAGVNDAVNLESADEHLAKALADLARRLEDDIGRHRDDRHRTTPPSALPAGFITSVFSPKGGVGKSVIAVNLAAALIRRTGEPVVVVDLDLQFGDVAVMLRLQPRHTIADALGAGDLLDEALLRTFLARHDKSGIFVLPAPISPSEADLASPTPMLRVLELLRDMFPYVVVDTPPHLSELVLQAVAASDAIAFLVGLDVPSVKNAHLGLQAFDLLQVPRSKVALVLNRSDSKVHLTTRDIETALETTIDVGFPSDLTVPQSVNQGQPALLAYPRSRFTAQAYELADLVLARADETKEPQAKRQKANGQLR